MLRFFICTAFLLLSLQSFADSVSSRYYLKSILGTHSLQPVKEGRKEMGLNLKQSSILSPYIGFGIGYYATNNIRADLSFGYYFPHFQTDTENFAMHNTANGNRVKGGVVIKRQAFIQLLMLHGYVDILERENYKIFIGGGIGVAAIKEKINLLMSGNIIKPTGQIFTFPLITSTQTTKKVNNFTHSLLIGSSCHLNANMYLDTMYSWQDFGKTKPIKVEGEDRPTKNRYHGHHFTIGVRFDL